MPCHGLRWLGKRIRIQQEIEQLQSGYQVGGGQKTSAGVGITEVYADPGGETDILSICKRVFSPAFFPRSNHFLTIVDDRAYIFNEEDENRNLVGDEVHIVTLPLKKKGSHGEIDYKCVPSLEERKDDKVSESKAGHVTLAIEDRSISLVIKRTTGKR